MPAWAEMETIWFGCWSIFIVFTEVLCSYGPPYQIHVALFLPYFPLIIFSHCQPGSPTINSFFSASSNLTKGAQKTVRGWPELLRARARWVGIVIFCFRFSFMLRLTLLISTWWLPLILEQMASLKALLSPWVSALLPNSLKHVCLGYQKSSPTPSLPFFGTGCEALGPLSKFRGFKAVFSSIPSYLDLVCRG